MRHWIVLVALFAYAIGGYCQLPSKAILYCDTIPGTSSIDTRHYVYIETDTNADCYSRFSNISDITTIAKENKMHLGNRYRKLPCYWSDALQLYKNDLFLYAPCDWYSHRTIALCDSFVIEGPETDKNTHLHTRLSKISDGHYRVTYSKGERKNVFLHLHDFFDIYLIDTPNNIAVFEEVYPNKSRKYGLVVNVEHETTFPVIVNYCCEKYAEWHARQEEYYIDFAQTIRLNKLIIGKKVAPMKQSSRK